MSFAEKITGLLARPNQQEQVGANDVAWYVKYGGRIIGIVGAFFAILCGLLNAITFPFNFEVTCLLSGIIQMLAGFVVMALEAPCCFICIDYVGHVADQVDARPLWNRAALYCILSIIPIILCHNFSSIFGCALIFGTGAFYGMMALGKKASAEEMRQNAVQSGLGGTTPTTNDRAGIINNAQPFSFTGAVGTDSNV